MTPLMLVSVDAKGPSDRDSFRLNALSRDKPCDPRVIHEEGGGRGEALKAPVAFDFFFF